MSFDLFKDLSVVAGAVWRDPKECSKDAFWHRSFFDGLRVQAHAKFFVDETPGKITVTPGEFILTLENASPAQEKAVQNEAGWLSLAVQYGIPADALLERYTEFSMPAAKAPTDWARLAASWSLERSIQFCRIDLVMQPQRLTPQPALTAAKTMPNPLSVLSEITKRIPTSDVIVLEEARQTLGKGKLPAPRLPHPAPSETSF